VSIRDITRTLAAKNAGEQLLVELSNSMNAGKLPSDEAVRLLNAAVDSMLSQEDPQQRLNLLQRKLGLTNPGGRPLHSKNDVSREQGERMARAYWWRRLLGSAKGKAREKVAAEFQSSGEFEPGYPSPETVKNNVERYPHQAEFVFYYWRILLQPCEVEINRAVDEIRAHLTKFG
jgi:hypothetical protein